MLLSIIIPVFNEERLVGALLQKVADLRSSPTPNYPSVS
jgi:glycosyltransferase involved in cell wall biosynthesis